MRKQGKKRTLEQTIGGNESDLGRDKARAKGTLSGERIGVTIAELTVIGYLGTVLVHVVQNY